jgi:hypothetical protein
VDDRREEQASDELKVWSQKLGCTVEELRSALQDTGGSYPYPAQAQDDERGARRPPGAAS